MKGKVIAFLVAMLLISELLPILGAPLEGPVTPFYFSTSTRDTKTLNGSVNGYSLIAGQILNVTWSGQKAGQGTTSMRFYLLNSTEIGGWKWVSSTGTEQTNLGYLLKNDSWGTTVSYKVPANDTYYVILVCEGNYAPYTPEIHVTSYVANVFSPPQVSITPGSSVTLDSGQSQLFNSTVSNGTSPFTYQWYLNGNAVPGQASLFWNFTPSLAGSYTVYLNVNDSAGFTVNSASTIVYVNILTNVSISPTSPLVMDVGQSQLFNSTVTYGTSPYSYQWYLNANPVSAATSPTWTFSPNSTGTCSVYVAVADSSTTPSRVQSNTIQVTVNPTLTVTINPLNSTIYLTQSQTYSSNLNNTGSPPYSYQWILNGIAVPGATYSNWSYNASSIGLYQICLNVTDSADAVAQSVAWLNVTQPPPFFVTISPSSGIIDAGQSVSFNSSVTGGVPQFTYQWYVNGSSVTGAASNWSFTAPLSGSYQIYVNSTDSLGVIAQSNIGYITVNPPPILSINASSSVIYLGQSLQFSSFVSGGTSPDIYQWYVDGTAVSAAANPTWDFTPSLTGSYTVYANITDSVGVQTKSNTVIVIVGYISVTSEFSGYFLQSVELYNTFGLYTNISGTLPIQVIGTLGGVNYTFSNPQGPGGSYNLTINMGSLQPNSTLEVSASYSDGTMLNASYPITVVETPLWLNPILNATNKIDVEPQMSGEWNNAYYVNVEQEFDLSEPFNVPIPLPNYAGGGTYTLMPSIEVDFSFYSNGAFNISAPFTLTTPEMNFGMVTVQFHVTVSVSGEFDLQDNTIEWQSATFSLSVGADTSTTLPIAGYTFGDITVGFSATINVDANFAANMVLAPTENASQELIPGLQFMIQSITGQIGFDVGVALNAGCGIASVSGGGSINFLLYLKAMQPYISGGVVSGTVYIKCHFLFWDDTLWNMTGNLYEWGSDPYIGLDQTSNFTLTSRYYNTSDYEGFMWTDGYGNATAIQDVYPFTRISAAASGDSVYFLYSSDNVSMSEENGLSLGGLQFSINQRVLQNLTVPLVPDEISFDPVITTLPIGTLLGMWDSVPFSEVSNSSSPFDINSILVQYSFFDTQTGTWGSIENLTETGVATSYMSSSDPTGSYALVLEGDSIFPTSQNLVQYNVETNTELLNISVTNVTNIISFNSLSNTAVLQMNDGSYELMNLSSVEVITLPSMNGYTIENVQPAMNSTDSFGILYSNSNSSIFSIYNIYSNTSFNMAVPQSTSGFALMQAGSRYQLITCEPSDITSYIIEYQTEASIFYPIENITSMGATLTDKGILVYTTENYGNSSYPLLNLTLTYARALPGDLNGDFKVSLTDLVTLAMAYGSQPGTVKWNANADLNGNGIVDLTDLVILALHYGQHYP